jgi:hypothetical protein
MKAIGMKKRPRIRLWNIRTMFEASRLSQVLKEKTNYKLDLLGLSKKRWCGSGELTTATGELLLSQRKHAKDWITEGTWNEIKARRATKQKLNSADDTTKLTPLTEYSEINKRIKRYARSDERTWGDKLAHKA